MKFNDSEYLVEFFGGFIPGIFFVLFSSLCLIMPTFLLFSTLLLGVSSSPTEFFSQAYSAISDLPSIVWIVLATLLFSISYFLGHIFHRQDPKAPNQKGFEKLKTRIENKHNGAPNLEDILKRDLCCLTSEQCEFPYPYLHNYLEFRGLDHLCELVVWKENPEHRSKNYINILKMRLQYHVPEKCNNILKNEAHVRLATSMWYVAGALIRCAQISLALVVAALFFAFFRNFAFSVPVYGAAIWNILVISLTTTFFIYVFSKSIRDSVESFIHYQRQREVIHVLETAWIAFGEDSKRRLPPFEAQEPV